MQSKLDKIPTILRVLLMLRRPYGSVQEETARTIVQDYVSAYDWVTTEVDTHGNLLCQIGEDNGVVFTAHLDTVHYTGGTQDLFVLDLEQGAFIGADCDGKGSVLGADDAAGIFLMTELMRVRTPGKYFFFIGEEQGGIGSSAFVNDNPEFSANMVVSFDRRGTTSIITHQGGYRTCSDTFGTALAKELNINGSNKLAYRIDDCGLYTDSREFAELVPECTNISVGYFHEHTAKETLNLTHLLNLRDALLKVKWLSLPTVRVPEPDEPWGTSLFSTGWYDTPDEGTRLAGVVRTYLDKNWDTVDSKLRQLLIDMENYLNDQI
ncbi:hypothetical protein [Pectobacterium phage CX5]|uniref:Peptidase M28 domain-containing protein n=1 Tax=Pectobacterium phage CX5 TaxID=2652426 RepID=A0A5P8D3K3_9CAUD|nr:hypothetical protein [Pectobacterium phage CX5]QFP93661.1 hypothetical protein [Pectobacterium phage CX5-1]